MDVGLHRIEALPGEGRYSVTFAAAGASEQSAVVQLRETGVDVAPASLPPGWEPDSDAFVLLVEALRAFERARHQPDAAAELQDVEGGWDVMLGNVVLSRSGVVTCAAHAALLQDEPGLWSCPECGARARYVT